MLFPFLCLPAAKPSGPRTVRVVVVVGGGQVASSLVPPLFEYLSFEFSCHRDLSSLQGGIRQDQSKFVAP